jgi:hypothetical protein
MALVAQFTSGLVLDKRQYGFGFACDEPGRGVGAFMSFALLIKHKSTDGMAR